MLSVSILLPQLLNAQGGVGIGTDNPHQSAILHIESPANNRGLLIPRLTREQINAMTANATEALLLYDTSNRIFIARINGEWRSLNTLVSNGLSTSDAYINTTGLIGLGTPPEAGGAKVQVAGSISATGTVTASSFVGEGVVPPYGIIMWHGSGAPPAGWALCDGTNNTPDLRDRFIVGSGGAYALNAVGGLNSVSLTLEQMPPHTHRFRSGGNRGPGGSGREPGSWTDSNVTYPTEHSVEQVGGVLVPEVLGVDNSGYPCTGGPEWAPTPIGCNPNYGEPYVIQPAHYATAAHENRPPYYALAFIMKLP